jgi:DNA-binding XRE family transcriptional regulator
MKKKGGIKGLVSFDEVMAALPEDERKLIEARGAELIAKIRRRMTLKEMRKGQKISQATVADALGIGQMQISRLEQRKDPRLSTMQRTVAAMGGKLTMLVTFPDQEPMVLVTKQGAAKRQRRVG